MRVNVFLTILGIVFSCLIGYLAYYISAGDENNLLCGIGSTVCFAITLIPAMGLKYESSRIGISIRIFSFVTLIAFVISCFCFAKYGVTLPHYILVNGILLIIYLAIFYKLQGTKNL